MVSCVCSGYIPHHKSCSVYVISRVQIAFHITHHSITPHQKILHHATFHVTPFHITPPLHRIPHHITTYHMFHAISRTFNVATHLTSDHRILHLTSHNTAVCLPPPFHTTTSQSTCSTSTSHTIPYTQLFHTTPTFSIIAYFTPHHTPHALHHHI